MSIETRFPSLELRLWLRKSFDCDQFVHLAVLIHLKFQLIDGQSSVEGEQQQQLLQRQALANKTCLDNKATNWHLISNYLNKLVALNDGQPNQVEINLCKTK